MATIVHDTFTVATNTDLTAHTPDIGTGWTEVYSTVGTVASVRDNGDLVTCGDDVASTGQAYTAQPAPSTVDQDITVTLDNMYTGISDASAGLFARRTDNSNFYHVELLRNDHTQSSVKLWKFVAGVATEIGAYDFTLLNTTVIKLEVRDATKKVFIDGFERISSTDNALTSVGTWGIYWGDYNGAGIAGDADQLWKYAEILMDDPGASSGRTHQMML